MSHPKFIAVLNTNAEPQSPALGALTSVVHILADAEVLSTSDNAVLFSADPALVEHLGALFKDQLLIEQDQALTIEVPGPASEAQALRPSQDINGDDKDPDEIVVF